LTSLFTGTRRTDSRTSRIDVDGSVSNRLNDSPAGLPLRGHEAIQDSQSDCEHRTRHDGPGRPREYDRDGSENEYEKHAEGQRRSHKRPSQLANSFDKVDKAFHTSQYAEHGANGRIAERPSDGRSASVGSEHGIRRGTNIA
jgi:hypothetical protein